MSRLSKICKGSVVLIVVFGLAGMIGCGETILEAENAPASWTLQFSDDFERAELGDDWNFLSGNWSIKEGWLTNNRGGESGIVCARNFPGAQRLEFDARSDNPGDLTGIICAYGYSYWDGYFVGFGTNSNSRSKLLIQGFEVKEWDAVITPGKIHHQIVQRNGDTITHIVDGETVMTYKHDQPLKGKYHQKVGFYIWTTGQIDNVKVYTKPE